MKTKRVKINRRKCCIVGCNTSTTTHPNVRFFKFPQKNTEKYHQWIAACKDSYSRIVELRQPIVCANHFEPDVVGKKKIHLQAVPSLNLDVPKVPCGCTPTIIHVKIKEEPEYVIDEYSPNGYQEYKFCLQCYQKEEEIDLYRSEIRRLRAQVEELENENKALQKHITDALLSVSMIEE